MNLSFLEIITFNEAVTPYSEIGRTKIGGNQEVAENAVKSSVLAVEHSPKFTPISYFWRQFSLLAKLAQLLAMVFGEI